jgi:polysaccharide pyruvyl transferase CsaB
MSKITICGYYGYQNTGDEAILSSIIDQLNTSIENIEILAFSGNPEESNKIHNVNTLFIGENWSIRKTFKLQNFDDIINRIRVLSKSDLVLIGGGGIIHDLSLRSVSKFWLNKIIISKLLGKKVMIYSVGVGPINSKIGKLLVKYSFIFVDIITVRDQFSKNELLNIGLNSQKILKTADPVFTLSPSETNVNNIFIAENISTDCEFVGISVRWNPYEFDENSSFLHEFNTKIARIADYIIENLGVNVLFIPMQFPPRETNDKKIMLTIRDIANNKDKIHILSGCYEPHTMLSIFGRMEMVIGMRLHSLIFSSKMNIPFIGLSYSSKTNEVLKLLDQEQYTINYKDINLNSTYNMISEVWDNRFIIRDKLRVKSDELRNEALINIELVKQLLEG